MITHISQKQDHDRREDRGRPGGARPDPYLRIFINDNNELRSGWRVAAFIGCFVVAELLINSFFLSTLQTFAPSLQRRLYDQAHVQSSGSLEMAWSGFVSLINFMSAAIATWLCARFLEHRNFASVGFKTHRGFLRDAGLGLAMGTLALAATVTIELSSGALSLARPPSQGPPIVVRFAALMVILGLAAAFEELFFRGFAFQALAYDVGPMAALAITAGLFAVAHLRNPDATFFSTINTIVAGIWLGAAYLRTRSLWFATGLHLSWNLTMAFLFGLPVSGILDFGGVAILAGHDNGPSWISGGQYGPEGGAAACLVLLISCLITWKMPLLHISKEMEEGIKHGKPKPRFISILTPEE
jgi:membrane protease YdiL (CAAX protease family)